jgi:hypothetical protein
LPNPRFNVVIIGEKTRIASHIIPEQAIESELQFVVHEQGTPIKQSSTTYFNHFISKNGDKLEACIKIVECPNDTSAAMSQGYIRDTVLQHLSKADLIVVSVPEEDRSDYSDTRLHTVLQTFKHHK